MNECWKDFKPGKWQDEINVRDFIQTNYTPYEGTSSFLAGPTKRTEELMNKLKLFFKMGGSLVCFDISTGQKLWSYWGAGYGGDIVFDSESQLLTVIQRMVSRVGRRIDKSSPIVDARLLDGSRINAVIPPISNSAAR